MKQVHAQLLDGPAVHLGEPHLQHHLLAAGPAGQLQQVDDLRLRRARLRRSRRPCSMTAVLDTWPDRISASSLSVAVMSSPGKSACSCCCSVLTPGSTTTSYCAASAGAPDDQADRAGALAVDQHLARLHDDRVGDRRVRDRDARDVEVGRQHRRAAGRQHDALEAGGRRRRGLRRRTAAPARTGGVCAAAARRRGAMHASEPQIGATWASWPRRGRSLHHLLRRALRAADRLDGVGRRAAAGAAAAARPRPSCGP